MKKWISKKPLAALTLGLFVAGFSGAASAASYHIQEGDTFWTLSKKFGFNPSDLVAANPNADPHNLYEGLTINLPEGEETAKVEAVPSSSFNKLVTPSGQTLTYTRVLSAKATAYTGSAKENGGWAGLDYMGNPLKLGTIAVNPSLIPLGSKVYITGYQFAGLPAKGMIARATDVGGGIQGARVDIFVPTANARDFGIQNVKIYILETGKRG